MSKFFYILCIISSLGAQAQEVILDSIMGTIEMPINSTSKLKQVENLGVTLNNYPKDFLTPEYSTLIPYFEQSIAYSQSKKNEKDVLRAKTYLIETYGKLRMNKELLVLGDELRTYTTLKEMPEYDFFLDNLYDCYKGLEMYGEMLQIIDLTYENEIKKGKIAHRKNFIYKHSAAKVYYQLQNYEKAIEGFKHQYMVFNEQGNQLYKSSMMNNIGLCYEKMKMYDKALEHFNIALEELAIPSEKNIKKNNTSEYREFFKYVILGNIAKIDMHNGNIDDAIIGFKNEIAHKLKDKEYSSTTNAYLNLGKAYYLNNQPKTALKYVDSSLSVMSFYDNINTEIEAYELKGKILLLNGNLKEATHFHNIIDTIKDSLAIANSARDYMIATAKFDSENQSKELAAIRNQIVLTEKLKSYQWIALLISIIVISIIGYLYYNTKKDGKIINKQNKKLESSLHEKEILLKEVHHRVKNNLQVISGLLQLQTKKSDSPIMTDILNDSQRHIQSMSLIHQMLYDQKDIKLIPMNEYLKKLTNHLFYSLSGKEINCHVAAADIDLDIDKAIPLGLIITELVTNANKYAFKDKEGGDIWISLSQKQHNTLKFTYKDNGVGFTNNVDIKKSKTLGFKLINLLAEEMDAVIKITGTEGVQVTITFSKKSTQSYV